MMGISHAAGSFVEVYLNPNLQYSGSSTEPGVVLLVHSRWRYPHRRGVTKLWGVAMRSDTSLAYKQSTPLEVLCSSCA